MGSAAVELCRAGRQATLPLFMMRTLILLPGYAGGQLYKQKLERLDTMKTVPYLLIVVILRALLCVQYENLAYLLSNCSYFVCGAFGVYFGGALAISNGSPTIFFTRPICIGLWVCIFLLLVPAMRQKKKVKKAEETVD